ncbi:MAG: arginyltransferase [Labilithrix sp.]|nr:arginyltransferase [Labilithrix sp.]MCW5815254.1 arginyltransferase [Labilithrix sp.]
MTRLLQHFTEPPRACTYLPDREAALEIRLELDVDAVELEARLARGWRRFGPTYFRPACASCNECLTLRIPAAEFTPTKSQRRARKNAAHLTRTVRRPIVDAERLALYARWHEQREEARGWDESSLDAERYKIDFAFPHPCVREVAFRDPTNGDRLVGLGIVDDTGVSLSAVYFYWDPEHAPSSLGTAHVVMLVEEARARGREHVYLGYRVEGCASLMYKGRFGPHELLEGRPAPDEAPVWRVTSPRP